MNGLVYIISITLILSWLVGFFILDADETIHVLLSIAIGLVAFRMMREERAF